MLQNPRLGAPAFSYAHVGLQWSFPQGWHVMITGSREGVEGYESQAYEGLATEEVVDLVSICLDTMLGT